MSKNTINDFFDGENPISKVISCLGKKLDDTVNIQLESVDEDEETKLSIFGTISLNYLKKNDEVYIELRDIFNNIYKKYKNEQTSHNTLVLNEFYSDFGIQSPTNIPYFLADIHKYQDQALLKNTQLYFSIQKDLDGKLSKLQINLTLENHPKKDDAIVISNVASLLYFWLDDYLTNSKRI